MKRNILIILLISIIISLLIHDFFPSKPAPQRPNLSARVTEVENNIKDLQKTINDLQISEENVSTIYESGMKSANATYTIMQIVLVFFGILFVGGIIGSIRLYFIGNKAINNRIKKIMEENEGAIQEKAREYYIDKLKEISSKYDEQCTLIQEKIDVFDTMFDLLSADLETQLKAVSRFISIPIKNDPRVLKLLDKICRETKDTENIELYIRSMVGLFSCGDKNIINDLTTTLKSMLSPENQNQTTKKMAQDIIEEMQSKKEMAELVISIHKQMKKAKEKLSKGS